MAKNFHMLTRRNKNNSLSIRLSGDFDGSSACELIQVLNKNARKNGKAAIDTDGLRTVDDFGLSVFRPHLRRGNDIPLAIEMTGRFRSAFLAE